MALTLPLHDADPPALEAPVRPLVRLLDDLAGLLLELPREVYAGRPLPGVSGSIGEHVRHMLDHVAAFVSHRSPTTLSYDRRERGTAVETDLSVALRAIWRLKTALEEIDDSRLAQPVQVTTTIGPSGATATGWSSMGRELAFVVVHTVHHQALVAVLLAVQGLQPPAWFGYAPSTPRS